MTGAWSLIASLSFLLLLAGMVSKNGVLLAIALPYLFFALRPLWRNLPQPNWRAERELEPDHLGGKQPCQIKISLTNTGEDVREVGITDAIPSGVEVEGSHRYYGKFQAGQVETLRYMVRGVRGKYEFSGIAIWMTDLLGLKHKKGFLSCPKTLIVLPGMERLEKIKISPRRTRVFSGMIRSRESGAGVEFFGTRAYVPGDPLRHLNWKAGARWDLLITNQFEQERIADVGIILDARNLVELKARGDSLFEHAVQVAASLADYFLREGNRVGLLIYGNYLEWTFPGYGKQQRARIMAALAGAELGEHWVFKEFENLPTRLFPPESQVVLVSPLRSEDVYPLRFLRALGYRMLIISPDPIAFEKDLVPQDSFRKLAERIARMERNVTLAKLRRNGIQVVDWDTSTPLGVAIRQTLAGFKR